MFKQIVFFFLACFFLTNLSSLKAQVVATTINPQDTIPMSLSEKRYLEQYNRNIKKTRIKGTYIPVDLQDAFKEINELSSKESLQKFASAERNFVVNRLHYGLGRWLIVNWNFYNGSRFSHYLKTFGLSHPDDMARFVLMTYHNYLNDLELNTSEIAAALITERASKKGK